MTEEGPEGPVAATGAATGLPPPPGVGGNVGERVGGELVVG